MYRLPEGRNAGALHNRGASGLSTVEMVSVALVVVALLIVGAVQVSQRSVPVVADTVTVLVEPADTLWGLARSHPVQGLSTAGTVDLIKQMNGLDTSAIIAGQALELPADPAEASTMASR
ncbi:MAG: LysM peptidoglycan-binding domain-containing protein [Coriobacteriales bacterium]|nr:LysM peptidoglycan-binding domain-containing protein [Actinomycetes bacterium]